MIRNLLFLSIFLMAISVGLYFSSYIIPFRVYFLEVEVDSKPIALKMYRDFQDYMKSFDGESLKYISLSNVSNEKKVIVKKDYSRVMLSVMETKEFLEKLRNKLQSKGYFVTIVPYEKGFYFAYLSNFIFNPVVNLSSNEVENINKKYFEYLEKDRITDYTDFLGSYFRKSDSQKIAGAQFYISKNFIINFVISPYITSYKKDLNIIKIRNIARKSYFIGLQDIVRKYKNDKIYINVIEDEKLVSLKDLKAKDIKKNTKKETKSKSKDSGSKK